MAPKEDKRPLTGIRVIDLTTARGELAGRFLADLGAEVIKVEPEGGAEARSLPPFAGGTENNPGRSLFWETVGLGKRSVVLDLGTAAGRDSVRGLANGADVLLESFDPGEMEAMGLDFTTLSAVNHRLVYVSITPFGQTGPKAGHPASDTTLQAAGGLIALQGDWDRRPIPVGEPYTATYHAGAQAAADTTIAINERERSGLGQHLDVSMQAAIVWILMNATGYPPNEGGDPPGYGDDRGQRPMSTGASLVSGAGMTVEIPDIWECADGYVSALILPMEEMTDVFMASLRWADELGLLGEHRDLLEINWGSFLADVQKGTVKEEPLARAMRHFRELFLRVSKREVMDRSIRDNLFFAPIFTPEDLIRDPQLGAREFWQTIGGVTHPGPFARFSETPLQTPSASPALGQDQATVDAAPEPAPGGGSSGPDRGLRPRPFEGLKVADFAWVGVGPLVAKSLADHGATVVHVESETRVDGLRAAPPFKGGEQDPNLSQFFANFNSSKLGLALNLATPEGKQAARRLIDWADVVVESFTPGTMTKLGLDYETVSRDRSDLVMFSTCLRGQTGPEAPLAGYGTSGAALSGLHAITGWPDRPPAGPWGAYTDFITPRLGTAAMNAALYHRSRTGIGQHIDVSQIECGIHFLTPEVLEYTVNGRVVPSPGDSSTRAFPSGVYQVEGAAKYIALSVESPRQWHSLRQLAFGRRFDEPELETVAGRRGIGESIDGALREWLVTQDPDWAVEQLIAAGVPASVVARPSDLYRDPQLEHREFFTELNHSRMGPTPYDGLVTRFSNMPSAPRTAAPCLGEHTDRILAELLGLEAAEIEGLREAGVLT